MYEFRSVTRSDGAEIFDRICHDSVPLIPPKIWKNVARVTHGSDFLTLLTGVSEVIFPPTIHTFHNPSSFYYC